jgi:hypothetical protein
MLLRPVIIMPVLNVSIFPLANTAQISVPLSLWPDAATGTNVVFFFQPDSPVKSHMDNLNAPCAFILVADILCGLLDKLLEPPFVFCSVL